MSILPKTIALLPVGIGGALSPNRIIAIARANSAPIKRLLTITPEHRILNLTYGETRQSVAVLEDGYLALLSISTDTLIALLATPDVTQETP